MKQPRSEYEDIVGHAYEDTNLVMNKARRVINWVPLLLATFLPWFLFLMIFRSVSYKTHYVSPLISLATVFFGLGLCCYASQQAWKAHKAARGESKMVLQDAGTHASDREFYWKYFACSFWVAVLSAWLLGEQNYWFHMQPWYDIEHLATYVNVDPSSERFPDGMVLPTRGKRYLDAGKVSFKDDVILDQSKAMAFRNGDLYCVAPLVSKSCEKNCGYDFWAVGVNCCSEVASDFRCGEYNNPRAKSGLRLMKDDERPFFRLAVMEAEGVHGIVSTHPLFFYWLEDPVAEIHSYKQRAYSKFIQYMIVFFFGNAACLGFSLKSFLSG